MITFRISADVKNDHSVVLTMPPEVPVGRNELIVSVATDAPTPARRPRSSLADWAEKNAEHWGDRLSSTDVEGFTGRRA